MLLSLQSNRRVYFAPCRLQKSISPWVSLSRWPLLLPPREMREKNSGRLRVFFPGVSQFRKAIDTPYC